MDQKTRDKIDTYLNSHTGIIRTSDFRTAGLHNSCLTELVHEANTVKIDYAIWRA
ncbi:MAG TPA: hypothetical protein PK941_05870 [Paludibacter sp.]|nr:hypothetical protein [Paludibacter sp.]